MTKNVAGTAVAVAVDADGPLCGVLIQGVSGMGKTSLALDLIQHCPFQRSALVADDIAQIDTVEQRAYAVRLPATAGILEVRGFGLCRVKTIEKIPLHAVLELVDRVSRMPEPTEVVFGPVTIKRWPHIYSANSSQRVRLVLRAILSGQNP